MAKSGVATQIVPNTNVIVKEDITTICTLAFANTPVQKVQLPSTLTTIRYGAFQNCTALKQITLPKSMTVIEAAHSKIAAYFLRILVPQNVTYLGASAFSGCSKPYICDIAAGNYKN